MNAANHDAIDYHSYDKSDTYYYSKKTLQMIYLHISDYEESRTNEVEKSQKKTKNHMGAYIEEAISDLEYNDDTKTSNDCLNIVDMPKCLSREVSPHTKIIESYFPDSLLNDHLNDPANIVFRAYSSSTIMNNNWSHHIILLLIKLQMGFFRKKNLDDRRRTEEHQQRRRKHRH